MGGKPRMLRSRVHQLVRARRKAARTGSRDEMYWRGLETGLSASRDREWMESLCRVLEVDYGALAERDDPK